MQRLRVYATIMIPRSPVIQRSVRRCAPEIAENKIAEFTNTRSNIERCRAMGLVAGAFCRIHASPNSNAVGSLKRKYEVHARTRFKVTVGPY